MSRNHTLSRLLEMALPYSITHDGYLDVFFVSGTRLQGFSDSDKPTNRLYQNDGHGHFIDVTKSSGLIQTGWGQGVCVGDYDNDGFDDLLVTYLGPKRALSEQRRRHLHKCDRSSGTQKRDESLGHRLLFSGLRP